MKTTRITLINELENIKHLSYGWENGEYGEPINESIIEDAYRILNDIHDEYLPNTIIPTSPGGIVFSWIHGNTNFSLELHPGTGCSLHKVNTKNGNHLGEQFDNIPHDIVKKIVFWLDLSIQ